MTVAELIAIASDLPPTAEVAVEFGPKFYPIIDCLTGWDELVLVFGIASSDLAPPRAKLAKGKASKSAHSVLGIID